LVVTNNVGNVFYTWAPIYIANNDTTNAVLQNIFVNNNFDYCGGLAVYSELPSQKILNIINATFTYNVGQFGGAIYTYAQISNIQIMQSTIANNIAFFDGGAVEIFLAGFTFISTSFYNNTALNGNGGAFDIQDFFSYVPLYIINCTIQGNLAAQSGGAISIFSLTYLNFNIQNSIISKNTASQAGGIFIDNPSSQSITISITNTTLTNNLISIGGCESDIVCTSSTVASINLGISNCTANNCTLPLVDCSYGCTGDICKCAYSSISYCTPLKTCPVTSSYHAVSSHHASTPTVTKNNNVAIIAACSSVGAACILVSLFFINRKYRILRIGSYGRFD